MVSNLTTSATPKPVPAVPIRHRLFRNLRWFARDPLTFLAENQRRYGDFYESNLSPFFPVLMLSHPDYVKHVLVDNNRNYRRSFAFMFLKQALGNGLLTSDGDFWRKQRRIAQPAFHRERLARLAGIMHEATGNLLNRWAAASRDGQPIDISGDSIQLTSEIAANALFSSDIRNILPTIVDGVGIINHFVSDKTTNPLRLPLWLPTPGNVRFRRTQKKLDAIIYQIIENRRRSGQRYDDLLQMLIETVDEETGERMDDRQLRDEVMTLFIAGSETSSNALSWAMYLLAAHPCVLEKMRQETDAVLGNTLPEATHLPKLTYTTQVIQEVMRLYPPAWILGRAAVKADTIGGFPIPPNAQVYLPASVVHRHPDWWETPDQFNPDHFSPAQVKQRHKYAYFPFGGGPRLCIGNNFAMLEITLILTQITRQFDFSVAPGQQVQPEPLITLRPKNGIWMRVHPRTD